MKLLYALLLLAACVLFALAGLNKGTGRFGQLSLVAFGLLAWVLVPTLHALDALN